MGAKEAQVACARRRDVRKSRGCFHVRETKVSRR